MIQYFLWIFYLGITSSMANNYCDLCKNHTMCEFKGRSPTCGKHVESGITASEAEEIVFLHNLYRSKIANGSTICGSPGPQPPAANMNALTWDENLAKVAQRWADQCNFDHDKCRRDARFQVGQNMYVNIGPATVDWRRAIKSWYSGVLKFNKSTVDSFQSNVNTNFYTQLVWANTRYIGCGRTIFETTSNNQENSLKCDKFISSTINGLKNKATNKQSDTDGAKINRQKRDVAEYFGEASYNLEAARGALGTIVPNYGTQPNYGIQRNYEVEPNYGTLPNYGIQSDYEVEPNYEIQPNYETQRAQMMSEISNDEGYYPVEQYGAEIYNYDERTKSITPWSPVRRSEKIVVYPQPTQYQEAPITSNNQYYYLRNQQQPVQQNYFPYVRSEPAQFHQDNNQDHINSYSSNYNDHLRSSGSDNIVPIPEDQSRSLMAEELRKILDAQFLGDEPDVDHVTDASESSLQRHSKYIPGVGLLHYYGGKVARAARSVDSENHSDNDDDSDNGDDILFKSEKILEKTSSQQSASRGTTLTRKQILVCNYGPTGNVIDQPIYIKGKLCSECPPNTTCKNGLCSYN